MPNQNASAGCILDMKKASISIERNARHTKISTNPKTKRQTKTNKKTTQRKNENVDKPKKNNKINNIITLT